MICRHCHHPLPPPFLDLGFAPPSNAYLTAEDLHRPELTFPLRVCHCPGCGLVQTEDYARADELFQADYAYFSSTSPSWVAHARQLVEAMCGEFRLGPQHHVVEIASNDGYLLQHVVRAGIPCLGIEPTASTAATAESQGIPVRRSFFGTALADELGAHSQQADWLIGNNVLAHVPDINDFVAGLARALKPEGILTLEFPHLLELLRHHQFDTIYHEHYSYLSLDVVQRLLSQVGLRIWRVQPLTTHGGSLRIFASHLSASYPEEPCVARCLTAEHQAGLGDPSTYPPLQSHCQRIKHELLRFLLDQAARGHSVAAYGAAAKGNTLLNYAGIGPDLLPWVCDAAPSKQGQFLPGSHIPILPPQALRERRPDVVLILPWNLTSEIRAQHDYIHEWGGAFYRAIPTLERVSP